MRTWSGPEGSSHSGNIECRGVAGGAASISGPEFYKAKRSVT